MIPPKFTGDAELVVLKHDLDEKSAIELIEKKKTGPFRKMMKAPGRDQVRMQTLDLFYEAILKVSARYEADFFRKATHTITVEHNVSEVLLGAKIFPPVASSRIRKALAGKRARKKVELDLEEHLSFDIEDHICFDRHGDEIKLKHKIDPGNTESYPKQVLRDHTTRVRKMEVTPQSALDILAERMRDRVGENSRDINDEFTILGVVEAYVPIFEARLTGPDERVHLMRIDATRRKVL